MKLTLIFLFSLTLSSSLAQNAIGIFSSHQDIGNPQLAGDAIYDIEEQEYRLSGSGYNIWFERDEFHFLYNKLEGDFILTANFAFEGEGVDPHRKVGWMVRASEAENDVHCSAALHGDGLTAMQWRQQQGASMQNTASELHAPKPHYQILQLERKGKTLIFRAAHPGEPLQHIGSQSLENLPDKVLGGLFICSHQPEVIEKARIWNVRIDHPVDNNYNPGEAGWLGCRLETLDVFSGKRKIVYESGDRFEAPNWMPDGQKLLFNSKGLLYTIPVKGGTPQQLNTGFANRNNNDHGISFDGKLLAISHHREGMPGGGSTVYVLPLEGGPPQLITEETPSYWHGWAPNNEEVVYVAQRNGSSTYNIYKNSISGGQEVALTDNKPGEHVDGCEYSPDGKYIYYNGSQSGTMQIWRMKPDGSDKEQITFDEYNDWFPHISPDGKWIAFISFPPDIEFNSHPSYKRVMLRLMPTSGGAPRVIAYLYGGQGTINVPSWSPDSKHLSFVSNSGKQ
ncbi:TolB family protein [Sunxiuqinia rutila]|uniref:TolB family protein n=1 Tax=Sunxiuqinia rutila TaxID=1397841 RepID=UPI003D36C7AC